MFGGFDLAHLRFTTLLLVALFGTAVVVNRIGGREGPPLLIEGPIERHRPGELVRAVDASPESSATSRAEAPRAGLLEPGGLINVNEADGPLLEALPGIGPARAGAILQERERGGPFQSPEDMERVSGIGPKTVENLRPYITVGSPPPPPAQPTAHSAVAPPEAPVRVNHAGHEELQRLHRVGPAIAQRIIDDRNLRGPYRSPRDMLRVSGIGPSFLEANRHMMLFD